MREDTLPIEEIEGDNLIALVHEVVEINEGIIPYENFMNIIYAAIDVIECEKNLPVVDEAIDNLIIAELTPELIEKNNNF